MVVRGGMGTVTSQLAQACAPPTQRLPVGPSTKPTWKQLAGWAGV